jgi:hypothetical protein
MTTLLSKFSIVTNLMTKETSFIFELVHRKILVKISGYDLNKHFNLFD